MFYSALVRDSELGKAKILGNSELGKTKIGLGRWPKWQSKCLAYGRP